jgi:hypothetical protein
MPSGEMREFSLWFLCADFEEDMGTCGLPLILQANFTNIDQFNFTFFTRILKFFGES